MHATAMELELLVSGRLAGPRAEWLEAHCEGCEPCAAAVTREARLEVSLRSMAAERRCGMRADALVAPVAARASLVLPSPRFVAVAVAAAMALAFFVARFPRAVVAEPAVMFADAGDFVRAQPAVPAWAGGETSGGTP